ncbi:hypothetical protein B0A55_10275 [Friedmanniomyces simplex]|uniref:Uncharacterized protein n=1 Tax=Friedmanniomyces simplex TaxID=329884 RepID=A0A4U0WHX5_9PEZI|nr:hypothetical protein B0A55_10275 [Friedmanniomyces simplex]
MAVVERCVRQVDMTLDSAGVASIRGERKGERIIGDIIRGDMVGDMAEVYDTGDDAAAAILRGSRDGDRSRDFSCSGETSILGSLARSVELKCSKPPSLIAIVVAVNAAMGTPVLLARYSMNPDDSTQTAC